ncbi:MAG: mismatch-specific DNA-glycosylase [Halanaerobiales bacterium]
MSKLKELPDYLDYNLKVIFIGFNPGIRSAQTGHHYAGRNNRFWKLLYDSGLTPYQLKPEEDFKLLELGYGLTNIVMRPSKKASDLNKEEYLTGRKILKAKLRKYKPEFACFTGIGVYRNYSDKKDIERGLQDENEHMLSGIKNFVISSPSGLNRTPYQEQLARYKELEQLLTHIL